MPATCAVDIGFGDCEPAGILFGPNPFRRTGAAFHRPLHTFGGHAATCARPGATGDGPAGGAPTSAGREARGRFVRTRACTVAGDLSPFRAPVDPQDA